ncbi:4-alpha-glucanotransferase, partial [Salmonella enterica subsp. enterica serovar Virginia]|nr:4-alpha-glucanotransferase [Salmonella enterica subsp. enterica serovar Virginia]
NAIDIVLSDVNMPNMDGYRLTQRIRQLGLTLPVVGVTANALAVLALESQRHRCMVIGEDLGTVPVEIVGKLRDSGVYSYKVLWF